VDHWIKRTHGERSEHVKESISGFHESRLGEARNNTTGMPKSRNAKSRKDLDRQITKDCGPLIKHEEGL
jgi:hypothetical protein